MEGAWATVFTEVNPDKGTKTLLYFLMLLSPTSLQKLTPIRGRKHLKDYSYHHKHYQFTEVNPDKGTKTRIFSIQCTQFRFTEVNPDKGTKTSSNASSYAISLIYCLQKLTPIRGRKLSEALYQEPPSPPCLQKLTPIRGRKPAKTLLQTGNSSSFTEVNPDKGTKTISEGS